MFSCLITPFLNRLFWLGTKWQPLVIIFTWELFALGISNPQAKLIISFHASN
uniref:Uncharacterized protein n=1 Tax=Arundo donax TaxID=35708 RepID=A0A0A9HMS6_ARUDO